VNVGCRAQATSTQSVDGRSKAGFLAIVAAGERGLSPARSVILFTTMTGMDDSLRVTQIRLHRAVHGEAFRAGLDHLSRPSHEAETEVETLAKILSAQSYDTTWDLAAHRKIGREAIDCLAGAALVLAQKHIDSITGAIFDINSACANGGHGVLELALRRSVYCPSQQVAAARPPPPFRAASQSGHTLRPVMGETR